MEETFARPDAPPTARLHPAVLPLFVAAAAVLVYLNSLANGYALDDVFIVQKNTRVHDLFGFADIWLTPYWPTHGALLGLYRPLAIAAYSVQWAIGGGEAWVFHLANVLLHALVTVLVFCTVRHFASALGAAAGALIFAVHPLHTEAVSNIVGQAELIAAVTVLLAVLVHLRRPDVEVSWSRRAALVVLLFLGLLSKESAITMPGLLVLLDFAQKRVTLERASLVRYVRAMAMPAILLTLTLLAYLVLRFSVLESITGIDAAPAFPYLREKYRVLHAFRSWPEYVRLLVFPLDLAADYGPAVVLPVESFTPMVGLGFAILAAVVLLTLLVPKHPLPAVVAGWFLISMLTISNLFFPVGVLIAERTLYLPSAALSFAVAFLWDAALRHAPDRRALVAPAAAVLLVAALFGARTVLRNPDWKDTLAVLRALIRDHPEAYRSQWVLAHDLWTRGKIQQSEQHWVLAYRLWPRDSQFLTEYANFHIGQKNYAPAVSLLETSREMHPMLSLPHTLLTVAYLGVGRYEDVLRSAQNAADRGVRRGLQVPRAEALFQLGRYDEAAAAWRVALHEPRNRSWLAYAQLARALAAGGHPQPAAMAADSALATAPADTTVRRTVAALKRAAESGCMATKSCADPLLGWSLALRTSPADSARSLQNATLVSPSGGRGAPQRVP